MNLTFRHESRFAIGLGNLISSITWFCFLDVNYLLIIFCLYAFLLIFVFPTIGA